MILDKFTIQTQDSVAIARDKLARQIYDKPSPFELRIIGEVSENNFMLYRVQRRTIPAATINGWFEAVQSGTVVHLELELKSSLLVVYLLFTLLISIHISQITINNPGKDLSLFAGVMIGLIANLICICQVEKIFYRKKLPQIFS
jgi:hypothetical protein